MDSKDFSDVSKKDFVYCLIIIGIVALVMRLVIGEILKPIPHYSQDSGIYFVLANNLIEKHVYTTSESANPQPTSLRMPLYPLFLASIRFFSGKSQWENWILFVQYILGSLCCPFIAILGYQTANRRVGILAGFIAAFYVGYYYISMVFLRETLSLFILLLFFIVLIHFFKTSNFYWGCLAAFLFGISILNRPETILIGLILGILHFSDLVRLTKNKLAQTVVLVLLALGPWDLWCVRNWIIHHHFIPFSTDGAWGFYMGQVFHPDEAWSVASPKAMEMIKNTPIEYDWYAKMNQEAVIAAFSHPVRNIFWSLIKIQQTFLDYAKNDLSLLYPLLWAFLPFFILRNYRLRYWGLLIGSVFGFAHLLLGSWDRTQPISLLQTSYGDILIPGAIGFSLLLLRRENSTWKTMAASFLTLIISVSAITALYQIRLVLCDWIFIIGMAYAVWRLTEWLNKLAKKKWPPSSYSS